MTILDITFSILLALKLADLTAVSWWWVFFPVLVSGAFDLCVDIANFLLKKTNRSWRIKDVE